MAVPLLFLIFIFSNNLIIDEESIIRNKLHNQAKCWNDGDLDCFMSDYWKDENLMYIGKSGVTYGWQETLDNYKTKYPSSKEMGHLEFEVIKLKKINKEHYFMVGKWQLTRDIGDVEGHFSLIWKKIANDWVIISDHSS